MGLKLTLCTTPSTWDAFVASSPQGTVFCRTLFLNALEVDYDLWLVEEDGQLQCGTVILKQDGVPLTAPTTFTLYQGLLLAKPGCAFPAHRWPKWSLEVTQVLLDQLSQYYPRLSFCMHYAVEDLRGFQWFHYHEPQLGQFEISLAYTGLIDLVAAKDFETYLTTIRKTRRYEYRQALERGVTVEVSQDVEALDWLHKLTFQRQGLERTSEEKRLVRKISSAALSNGFGELLLCRDATGAVASATLFLRDAKCGYYLFGANDPAYRGVYGGTFLFLENVKRCIERGLQLVDVVGINSPNRGDFKTSFNAAPVPYFVVTWERPSRTSV